MCVVGQGTFSFSVFFGVVFGCWRSRVLFEKLLGFFAVFNSCVSRAFVFVVFFVHMVVVVQEKTACVCRSVCFWGR